MFGFSPITSVYATALLNCHSSTYSFYTHAVLKSTTSDPEAYRIYYYWHPSQIIITNNIIIGEWHKLAVIKQMPLHIVVQTSTVTPISF